MRARRILGAFAALSLALLAVAPTAQATTSPTNPVAPFQAGHGLTSVAYDSPVLAADGSGILAVYASPKADGRHLYVSRWTPAHGWGPATQLFVGALERGFGVRSVDGVAAVWWTSLIGRTVRTMDVAVRDGVGAPWGTAHQIFRGDNGTRGDVAVGSAGITAAWAVPNGTDPQVFQTNMTVSTWTRGAGWSADQVLSATVNEATFLPVVSAVGSRFVVTWTDVSGAIEYAVREAGVWTTATETAPAAAGCGIEDWAGSGQRFLVALRCSGRTYQARDWGVAAAAPTSSTLSVPSGDSVLVTPAVSGASAAVVSYQFGGPGPVWLQRSAAAGSWSAPSVVTTGRFQPFVRVALSGSSALVSWSQLSADGRHEGVMARATSRADGAFTSPVVAVSGWGPTAWSEGDVQLVGGPSGAVLAWLARPWSMTTHSKTSVLAATWTARGGWSHSRVLVSPALRYDFLQPTVAVAGANAMVGWASPTTNGATAAPLVSPTAVGRARVSRSGRTLTCTAPAFAPRPAAIAYRWQVNGRAVASGRVLRVSGALGKPLVCRAIASTQGFVPGSAYAPPAVVRA